MVYVVIVGWNNWELSMGCVESVMGFSPKAHIVFVNNGSTDNTSFLQNIGVDYLSLPTNSGFAGGYNHGLKYCLSVSESDEDYYCILNNDTVVSENWLSSLTSGYEDCLRSYKVSSPLGDRKLGYVAPLTTFACVPAQVVPSATTKPAWYNENVHHYNSHVPFVCLLFRRNLLDDVGFLDEEIAPFGMMEDVDYHWRMERNKYTAYIVGNSWILHYGSRSISKVPNIAGEHVKAANRMSKKHEQWIKEGRVK